MIQVSLFAELFNEMLQRDFGYRIYKALAAFPVKDEKKEKEKKAKKEAERKEAEKREIKKEKDEEGEEPSAKKTKEEEEDKRKASSSEPLNLTSSSAFVPLLHFTVCVVSLQGDDRTVKKESSRDEDENEDDGSTANAEEYDPMEAEDADDDDDDGRELPVWEIIGILDDISKNEKSVIFHSF